MSQLERLSGAPCRLRVDTAWRYATPYGMQGRASWDCTKAYYGMFRERTKGGERGIKVVWGRKRVGKERDKGIKEAGDM